MRDFNIDLLINDTKKVRMLDLITDQGDIQLINEATRITENSRKLIYYVCVYVDTKDDFIAYVDKNFKVTDHETVRVGIKYDNYKNGLQKKKIFKYSKIKFDNLLNNNGFSDLYYEQYFNDLTIRFNECIEKCFAAMTVEKLVGVNVDCQWYNSNLWGMKQEKIAVFRAAIYSNNVENWQRYKQIRNKYIKQQSWKQKMSIQYSPLKCTGHFVRFFGQLSG